MASEDENQLALQRDLAVRQAKLAHADLTVIQMALNENRPLEALSTANGSIERLDEELDAIENIAEAADPLTTEDPADLTRIPCGCGEYAIWVPAGSNPQEIGAVCPECRNHFGHGPAPDEPCPCRHDHGEGGGG